MIDKLAQDKQSLKEKLDAANKVAQQHEGQQDGELVSNNDPCCLSIW